MLGEFRVDQSRVHDFQKRWLKREVISNAAFFLLITFFLVSIVDGKEKIFVVLASIVVYGIVVAAVIGGMGKRDFETTRIVLDENTVIRTGKKVAAVKIHFNEVGRVITCAHGVVVIRRGIFPMIGYFLARKPLLNDRNVIFIPYLMHDFDQLKDFFLKKKYLGK